VIPVSRGAAVERSRHHRHAAASTLWLSETVVGGLVLLVALVAWVSLALADLGEHSLAAVCVLSAAAAGVVALVASRLCGGRVVVRLDRTGLIGVTALAGLASVMFFPGFYYGASDKDPGGYVSHAMEIARTGSYRFYDAASDPSRVPRVELASPGARFPGVWLHGVDTIVPQFFHLWPALMATSYDAAGLRGLANTAPLCGVLAVCALALAVRRAVSAAFGADAPDAPAEPDAAAGTGAAPHASPGPGAGGWLRAHADATGLLAGAVAGVALATNMLEVWQAKYPTTEISAQLFFSGSMLALIVALTTRWRPAAGMAGMLTGIGFLDRADDIVLLLLVAALGATLVALRRFDGRAAWFAGGVAVVAPHALWQAYSPAAARLYTLDNNVPTLTKVAELVAALYLVAVVARFAGRPLTGAATRLLRPGRPQLIAGLGVLTAAAGLVALGFLRPRLFGADYAVFGSRRARTFDEQSLDRLGWFVSRPAFLLALAGLGVVALRRWSAALWTLAGPLLVLLPLYAYHTHNSTRLMWWARRYVPTVLPGFLALVGVALGTALVALAARRWKVRLGVGLPALAVVAALLAFFLPQSLPLRHHDEMGGSFQITAELADLPGDAPGVFLWPQQACCFTETSLFPGALWLGRGQMSALLPADPAGWPTYIRSFEHGFPGSPVFVIAHGWTEPEVAGLRFTLARHFATTLPVWQESDAARPDHSLPVPVDFTAWRLTGT
jgi:hypothetical protein